MNWKKTHIMSVGGNDFRFHVKAIVQGKNRCAGVSHRGPRLGARRTARTRTQLGGGWMAVECRHAASNVAL